MAKESALFQLPDIILLDAQIPDSGGYALCRQLKHDTRTRDIPVIFISALDSPGERIEALHAGGVDYITRPFHEEEVLARVAAHLSLRTMHKKLQVQNILLRQEINERRRVEEELRQTQAALESRVQQRTAELTRMNVALHAEIEERRRLERKREATIGVAAALRVATSRASMVQILLEQVALLLNAEGTALVMTNAQTDSLVVEAGYGLWEALGSSYLCATPTLHEQVIANQQPCLLSQPMPDNQPSCPFFFSNTVQSVACIPLIADDQTIGALVAGCAQDISSDDVRVLTAIGDMAANAIHRASLHEQTRRRLERIQALHTIDQTITTSLNLQVTLNVLIFQAITQLDVDAAAVLLFKPDTHHLEYAAGHGFRSSAIQNVCLNLGEGLAGRTASGQSFLHIPNIRQSETPCIRDALINDEHFVSYYGAPLIARGRIKGVLELFHRTLLLCDQEWTDFLSTLAGQASIAIDNADMFAQLEQSNKDLARAYDATIEGWARALELRDAETEGHCRRVTDLTVRLARRIGFSDEALVYIRRGAILHDIGKMAIPDSILLKQGPLTLHERKLMEQHTLYAYNLLSPVPFLRDALDIPYCHHEKWDGSGYPRGLKGDEIPLTARIFSVVDVWDALCSDRPYRKGWSQERVRSYLRAHAGTAFDPQVVETFLTMVSQA